MFLRQKHKSLTISSGTSQEKLDELFFTFTQADKGSQAQLFEEIKNELEVFLSKENNDTDSTDSIFDSLSQISNSIQEEFDELLSGESVKKRFIKAMSKIFALLLNARVDTADKNKRIIKIAKQTTLKIWQGPKQQLGAYLW